MSPPAEQLIRDYLNRLSVAARGQLGAEDRRALVDRTRGFIERKTGLAGPPTAMEVARLLAGLGDPARLVQQERQRLATLRGEMPEPTAVRNPITRVLRRDSGRSRTASWHWPVLEGGRTDLQLKLLDSAGVPASGTAQQSGAQQSGTQQSGTQQSEELPSGKQQSGEAQQSGAQQSGAQQSGALESGAQQSGAQQSAALQSGEAQQSGAQQSGALESGAQQSGALESGAQQPGALQSDALEPGALQSGAQSAALQSGAQQSGALQSDALEPGALQSGALQSGAQQPGAQRSASSGAAHSGANGSNGTTGNGVARDDGPSAADGPAPRVPARPGKPDWFFRALGGERDQAQDDSLAHESAAGRPRPPWPLASVNGVDSGTQESADADPAKLGDSAPTHASPRWQLPTPPDLTFLRQVRRALTAFAAWYRRRPLEASAVVLLGLGGAIYPPVWLVGAFVALTSRLWDGRDKWLGLALPVLVTLIAIAVGVTSGGRASMGHGVHEGWVYGVAASRIAALLSAVYLGWRSVHGRRPPAVPPWNKPHKVS
jgi:hypothetical protein